MVDTALRSIGRRVQKAPHNKLEELGSRNVHRSSFAVTDTFAVLTEELKNEICSLLDSLSKMNLSRRQIRIIEMKIDESIDTAYETHKEYLKRINIFDIGHIDWTEYLNNQKEDSLSTISIKLLIIKSAATDRRIKFWWDLSKIVLTAIIGGVIGAYIKSKLGDVPTKLG
jgi:hypothetical protein